MGEHRAILRWAGLLAALVLALTGAPVWAADAPDGSDAGRPDRTGSGGIGLGIRLLEASSNRRDDPRARVFIVDHMNPGNRITRRFEVRNPSSHSQHVRVYAGAAQIVDHEFVPAADRDANEISSWVSIDRPDIVVPAHGRAELRATIDVPGSASKGERYGGIWAEARSLAGPRRNIEMVNQVGIRLYLDIGPGGDPPSDFAIDQLTPGRTADGVPIVKATVRNTGERALDLGGKLWLSEGAGGLRAGPYQARTGTTLAPGDSAPVMVNLDPRLPEGPWQVRLTLESGRVRHTITGRLTFPAQPGTWGLPAVLDSLFTSPVMVTAAAGAAAAVALCVLLILRRRAHSRHN
ncbi:hypothetical protein [Nonomuraea sp. NPDC050691]|uniref:hypothetical protein n=1 Tax=Nonomuraea sp. NPDC050691 TaxID=3155661 RepID=UPI0033E314C3